MEYKINVKYRKILLSIILLILLLPLLTLIKALPSKPLARIESPCRKGLVRTVQHKHTDYISFIVITEKGKELACKI
ncbi:MAG: hypothetical protein DRN04_07490 [Thermoprotei archaeon]|nr:MAG: hypothetical protein DRN04_07490 [Thermoprotei archaeon]